MKAKPVQSDELTAAELEFLARKCIPIAAVLNTQGMIPIGHRRALEHAGAILGINGKRCPYDHRLMSRSNRCVQCDEMHLVYESRHRMRAYVYVCVSESGFAKIGYADDVAGRASSLSRDRYGGVSDWRMVYSVQADNAGRVEAEAQKQLAFHAVSLPYHKNGREQLTREVFQCTAEQAVAAVQTALATVGGLRR
jgi:hypothetical protein